MENDDAFIAAAVELANNDCLRREMGQRAAVSMQRLHPEQVAKDFEAVLARIARGRKNDETAAAA